MKQKKWWHKNWYKQGFSHELFDYIREKQVVTKQECRDWLMKQFEVGETSANATVTTLFSPRKSSKRGDMRGNRNSNGEYYYMEKLGRKVHYGVKDPQKFCLRWRDQPLEARGRTSNIEIRQDKVKVKRVRSKVGLMKIKLNAMKNEIKKIEKEMQTVK